ncbi:MAG: stage III sporulation protein AB [Pelosinus sp.]|nr:stage III sporulation protein AB [Pelosinus sp.]
MWLKLVGSLFIIIAGSLLGFNVAARYAERPRQIRQLITCLASLKAYISYAAIPLPEALIACTGGAKGVISDFFLKTAAILTKCGWLTPQEAMEQALQVPGLVLEKAEVELLAVLGANLGAVDRIEQEKYLNMIHEQLQQLEIEAAQLSARNSKMYRYLGICGSLTIVILLV